MCTLLQWLWSYCKLSSLLICSNYAGIAIDGCNEVNLSALEVALVLLKRKGKVAALEEEIESTV